MPQIIDYSLYPDGPAPLDLSNEADAADYIHRVCGALDFGIVIDREARETLRGLRTAFDRYPLIASPAYHTFRRRFGWPAMKPLRPAGLHYQKYDRRDDRLPDPCLELI